MKDEKTKPNTVKRLWHIFQGTEHFERRTWEHAPHKDAFHCTGLARHSSAPRTPGSEAGRARGGLVTGSGGAGLPPHVVAQKGG